MIYTSNVKSRILKHTEMGINIYSKLPKTMVQVLGYMAGGYPVSTKDFKYHSKAWLSGNVRRLRNLGLDITNNWQIGYKLNDIIEIE